MARTFNTISIGRAARQALADGAEGRVLAVFRRSFYVEMADGRLACVGGSGLGDGPLNLRAAFPDDLEFETLDLAPGATVAISAARLTISSFGTIDMSGAAPWRPAPLRIPENDALMAGLDALARTAMTYQSDLGLALTFARRMPANDVERTLLDHAAPCIGSLVTWLDIAMAAPAPPPPPPDAAGLIGLGPGLTPSGDDWLGGAMIALTAFDRPDLARVFSQWTLPLAQQRTGKISIAHLAAAAAGEGSSALHGSIAAIAAADAEAIARALVAIDAIGHSSGWDALAGAAAIMKQIADR